MPSFHLCLNSDKNSLEENISSAKRSGKIHCIELSVKQVGQSYCRTLKKSVKRIDKAVVHAIFLLRTIPLSKMYPSLLIVIKMLAPDDI